MHLLPYLIYTNVFNFLIHISIQNVLTLLWSSRDIILVVEVIEAPFISIISDFVIFDIVLL